MFGCREATSEDPDSTYDKNIEARLFALRDSPSEFFFRPSRFPARWRLFKALLPKRMSHFLPRPPVDHLLTSVSLHVRLGSFVFDSASFWSYIAKKKSPFGHTPFPSCFLPLLNNMSAAVADPALAAFLKEAAYFIRASQIIFWYAFVTQWYSSR